MSLPISRRRALQASFALAGLLSSRFGCAEETSLSITGQEDARLAPFDAMMTAFLKEHGLPGAALAVTRASRLVYARGFGYAEKETQRPVQPTSLFRLASISKPITAVGILQLVEQARFRLTDRIFDLLPADQWLRAGHDPRLRTITVQHLLQHTGGWDRDATFDPITRVTDIAKTVGKPLPVGPEDVIRYTLTLPLDFDPGTRYAYYNVDYLLLGRLIEHVTNQGYEDYIREKVLAPAGITRMKLGRAWKDDLQKDEVCYYDSRQRDEIAVCGSRLGQKVPRVYGGENLEAYEAHGGWIGSAIDLVRFLSAFDRPTESPLLKADTIRTMWDRPGGAAGTEANGMPRDFYYGCGWSVRPIGPGRANCWHSGLIAGTSTLMVHRHDGLNWAVLFNCDADSAGKRPSGLIDPLVHQAADAVTQWPTSEIAIPA